MIKHTVFILLSIVNFATVADDAQINPVAKKIKAKVEKQLNKSNIQFNGYCDLMIEMTHKGKYTKVKRVTTSGDSKLCKYSKKAVKLNAKYTYKFPEKYIRIQIEP